MRAYRDRERRRVTERVRQVVHDEERRGTELVSIAREIVNLPPKQLNQALTDFEEETSRSSFSTWRVAQNVRQVREILVGSEGRPALPGDQALPLVVFALADAWELDPAQREVVQQQVEPNRGLQTQTTATQLALRRLEDTGRDLRATRKEIIKGFERRLHSAERRELCTSLFQRGQVLRAEGNDLAADELRIRLTPNPKYASEHDSFLELVPYRWYEGVLRWPEPAGLRGTGRLGLPGPGDFHGYWGPVAQAQFGNAVLDKTLHALRHHPQKPAQFELGLTIKNPDLEDFVYQLEPGTRPEDVSFVRWCASAARFDSHDRNDQWHGVDVIGVEEVADRMNGKSLRELKADIEDLREAKRRELRAKGFRITDYEFKLPWEVIELGSSVEDLDLRVVAYKGKVDGER